MKSLAIVHDHDYYSTYHCPDIEGWVTKNLKRSISAESSVLDVGCGLGFWGYLIKTYIQFNTETFFVENQQ